VNLSGVGEAHAGFLKESRTQWSSLLLRNRKFGFCFRAARQLDFLEIAADFANL
jgi:hypothetical protein